MSRTKHNCGVTTEICVRIKRYNPEIFQKWWQKYIVPIPENETWSVINLLDYISQHLDPSLAYYGPCRTGKCGGCLMKINGKAAFACATMVRKEMKELTIEPCPNRKIQVDLVTIQK